MDKIRSHDATISIKKIESLYGKKETNDDISNYYDNKLAHFNQRLNDLHTMIQEKQYELPSIKYT